MKRARLAVGAVLLVTTTAFATAAAVRQDGEVDMEEMMARMMELAAPGPEHAELMELAGKWTESYRMRFGDPTQPWMETTGTSESKPMLGGRYLFQTIQMDMMGMPMECLQILGYDKLKDEYTSLWMDSMSTWWVTSTGKETSDGTVEFKGTMRDVAGERPFRMVVRNTSADETKIEMYDTIPPHGEVLVMENTSQRKR